MDSVFLHILKRIELNKEIISIIHDPLTIWFLGYIQMYSPVEEKEVLCSTNVFPSDVEFCIQKLIIYGYIEKVGSLLRVNKDKTNVLFRKLGITVKNVISSRESRILENTRHYKDKSLQCTDCGATFTFSAEEQEFFQSKGYTAEPKRCPACRRARKSERYGGRYGYRPRQMFHAVCAECGKETEVPFEPREGRPVYCNDCLSKSLSRNNHTPR